MSQVTLEEQRAQILKAAAAGGSFVVTGVVKISAVEGYKINLNQESFVGLLAHSKPTAVYLFTDEFDPQGNLEAWWDIDDDNEDDVALMRDARVKQFIRKMGHAGEVGSLMSSFVVDGVLHTYFAEADWFSELEQQADELKAQVFGDRERKEDETDKEEKALVREYAKTLCEHPKFTEGRPSKEKRTYLAESLFADLDSYLVYRIVDEATNMAWLNSK